MRCHTLRALIRVMAFVMAWQLLRFTLSLTSKGN